MRSFACSLVLATAFASPAAAFEFTAPSGWRDLSPGAPAARFDGIPDQLAQEAARGYKAFAVDPMAEPDGSYATFNARVVAETAMVSEKFMDGFVTSASAAVAQQGLRYQVEERRIEEFQGVQVARFVATLTGPGGVARQLIYVMPGGAETAVLVYSCGPEAFARRLPSFETSARAIKGVQAPSRWTWLLRTDAGHNVLGKLTGIIVGVGVGLLIFRRYWRG